MADIGGWVPVHAVLTILVYLANFFLNGATLATPDGTVFDSMIAFINFILLQNVPGPEWFGTFLFAVVALPWLFLIASFLFSTTAGTITAVIGGFVATVAAFFQGLF